MPILDDIAADLRVGNEEGFGAGQERKWAWIGKMDI